MDQVLDVVLQRPLPGKRPRLPRTRASAGRPPIAHAKGK
jgi:hypothetical protein